MHEPLGNGERRGCENGQSRTAEKTAVFKLLHIRFRGISSLIYLLHSQNIRFQLPDSIRTQMKFPFIICLCQTMAVQRHQFHNIPQ